ncbi:MAG: SGNH/GDSL hydrolase family protein [Verrucomicrobiales bacterium]
MRCLLFSALALLFVNWLPAQAPLPLQDARRVLFLGDSITYSGGYVAHVATWLELNHPNPARQVLNLGLASETVSGLSEEGHAGGKFPRPDLHERLERVLAKTQPDLVLACYGMNCGIYQAFDEMRFQAYQKGITKLRAAVRKAGAEIIFITPWAYDHVTGENAHPTYNQEVLGAYAEWLLSRRASGWRVIDLHGAMSAEIARRQAVDPKFSFQGDGVHPGSEGHWLAGHVIMKWAGDEKTAAFASPQAWLATYPKGEEIHRLVSERLHLLRDAWLSETGHQRPGVKEGLPLDAAEKKAAEIGARLQKLRAE